MTFEDKIERLQTYYHANGVIPTYEDMLTLFGVSSKNSIFKFVNKAEKDGYIKRIPVRLAPTDKFFI